MRESHPNCQADSENRGWSPWSTSPFSTVFLFAGGRGVGGIVDSWAKEGSFRLKVRVLLVNIDFASLGHI